jgi:hypothetical protein
MGLKMMMKISVLRGPRPIGTGLVSKAQSRRVVLAVRDVENRTGARAAHPYGAANRDLSRGPRRELSMPAITHVFWRDIPAQVIVGKGRSGAKAPLPERFEQAIDRAAMKIGAKDEDAYLAEWRRVVVGEAEGDPAEIAASEAAKLDAAYDTARLKSLIDAEGHDPAKAA